MALRALRGTGPASPGAGKVAPPAAARRHQKGGSAKESARARGEDGAPSPPRPASQSHPRSLARPAAPRGSSAPPSSPSRAHRALSTARQDSGAPDPPTVALAVCEQVPHVPARSTATRAQDLCGLLLDLSLKRCFFARFVRGLRPGLPRQGPSLKPLFSLSGKRQLHPTPLFPGHSPLGRPPSWQRKSGRYHWLPLWPALKSLLDERGY